MELKNIVYITVNTLNGDFYIGVHKTNPETFDGYIGCGIYSQTTANEKYAFHKAVRKYGYKNFKRTTIAIFPDTEEGRNQAFALEAQIVNPTLLKSKQCYNMVVGGKGGERIKCNKKIYMFALNGNYLRSFKNTRAAAKFLISKGNDYDEETLRNCIKNVCGGRSQSCCKFYFSYTKKFNYIKSKNKKEIAQYSISGKFLRKWESIFEAENNFNCDICQALSKKTTAAGYQWRYYTNDDNIDPVFNQRTFFILVPIVMYNETVNIEYTDINECVKQNPELNKFQIMKVLKGKIKTHKGYFFKLKDEDIV